MVLTDVPTDPMEVTAQDVKTVNALSGICGFRLVSFEGIDPEVFAGFRTFPDVILLTVNYGMPEESVAARIPSQTESPHDN